jgi:hypothetical protein
MVSDVEQIVFRGQNYISADIIEINVRPSLMELNAS